MGDIVLLDEQTINKIAAGEVVDRPASIVASIQMILRWLLNVTQQVKYVKKKIFKR